MPARPTARLSIGVRTPSLSTPFLNPLTLSHLQDGRKGIGDEREKTRDRESDARIQHKICLPSARRTHFNFEIGNTAIVSLFFYVFFLEMDKSTERTLSMDVPAVRQKIPSDRKWSPLPSPLFCFSNLEPQ